MRTKPNYAEWKNKHNGNKLLVVCLVCSTEVSRAYLHRERILKKFTVFPALLQVIARGTMVIFPESVPYFVWASIFPKLVGDEPSSHSHAL